jgi:hypothetical protein
MNLLESAGFSRANPYYIVQQGKVGCFLGGGVLITQVSCACACVVKATTGVDVLRVGSRQPGARAARTQCSVWRVIVSVAVLLSGGCMRATPPC